MTHEARNREIAYNAALLVEYEGMLARQRYVDSPDALEVKAEMDVTRRVLDRLRAEQRRAAE